MTIPPGQLAPFFRHVGVEHLSARAGKGSASLSWSDRTANSSGSMHGGAVSAAMNAAMVSAVRSVVDDGALLVQLNINFLANGGDRIVATAEVCRAGSAMIFVTGRVLQDATGELVAIGTAVFSRRRPAAGGHF